MSRRVVRAVALIVPCVGVLGALASSRIAAQTPAQSTRLESGRPIEQTLTGRAEHRYELTLRQGEHADVSVLQRSLDVVIQIAAPDGTILGEFDDEPREGRDEHAD